MQVLVIESVNAKKEVEGHEDGHCPMYKHPLEQVVHECEDWHVLHWDWQVWHIKLASSW